MIRLLWAVWDYLTYTRYCVKIKTYSDGSQWCYPQRAFRFFPVWMNITDCGIYGTVHRYRNERLAWTVIDELELKNTPIRLRDVKIKYRE